MYVAGFRPPRAADAGLVEIDHRWILPRQAAVDERAPSCGSSVTSRLGEGGLKSGNERTGLPRRLKLEELRGSTMIAALRFWSESTSGRARVGMKFWRNAVYVSSISRRDRPEYERALPRSGHAGEDRQLPLRNVDGDIAQIIFARAADFDSAPSERRLAVHPHLVLIGRILPHAPIGWRGAQKLIGTLA